MDAHPTHIDSQGMPTMVDVGDRAATRRQATARAQVRLPPGVLALVQGGEILAPKGAVFSTAIVAGTMGAKRTSDLIPFCHPLPIEKIRFECGIEGDLATIDCTVACTSATGVEMEALTGASIAALTVYDMCKALDLGIVVESVRLIAKSGGRRDFGAAL